MHSMPGSPCSTWSLRINSWLGRSQARVALGFELARCLLRIPQLRVYWSALNSGLDHPLHCLGLVTNRPGSSERIRFTGIDASAVVAAKKAFAEFLEAKTQWNLKISEEESRSGWACASTEALAVEHAYRELLERDAILTHFLCPELGTSPLNGSGAEFRLVRLQCADPSLHVVMAGYRTSDGRWLLGGACSESLECASEKARVECAMLRQHWTPLAASVEQKPKLKALWPHWESTAQPAVQLRLQSLFDASEEDLPSLRINYHISRANLTIFRQVRYSPQHLVIEARHPDLVPLTFSGRWMESEGRVREIFRQRGLKLDAWLWHPML